MVRLVFNQSHASINVFPNIDLPDFTLITGPNGVGKSHLLQSIHMGRIKSDLAPNQSPQDQTHIRLFDWSTLVPQDTGYFSSENIRGERHNLFNSFNNLRTQHGWLEPARAVAREFGLEEKFIGEPARALEISSDDLEKMLGEPARVHNFREKMSSALDSFGNNIINNLDVNSRAQILAVSNSLKRPIFSLNEKDIMSPSIPTWGQNDLFQQSFARLFVSYRDLKLANTISQFRAHKGERVEFLSDEEFLQRHGPPPWEFVNQSLMHANLDFEINSPYLDDYQQFQPTLKKRSTGVEIPFHGLSSGEKVLMSFAFCVYYSNDRRQISVQPKILLLDEIDAPLHPSMSRNIIDTITNVLVGKFGIKIIATTHSPSTIALAPEESIFTMQPGKPGLHKTSKAAALNILTVGVPTIAISFDGRRQVFVESPADAKIYDALYKLLKPKMSSERSLEFVATGTRISGGTDRNTGCEVVKRLVESLASAGNISVFGLIDWDGTNNPDDRISVLAHGSKNGLENVVLDPLLIGLAISRSFPNQKHLVGVSSETSYLDIATGDPQRLSIIAQAVANIILGPPGEKVSARYCGGLVIEIDRRYFEMDDHLLESTLIEKFPFLKEITKNQNGKLVDHIISNVLSDSPDLVPVEVKEVLESLLERPAHA